MKIKKAIILVAGFGSRMLPATKAIPKAMLPIFDRPIVEKLVDEAISAGVEEIIFVTDTYKKSIEDHFDTHEVLEKRLATPKKKKYLDSIKKYENVTMTFVRQKSLKGDGDAILHASYLVGDEPCLVLFGDDIMVGETTAASQITQMYAQKKSPIVGVVSVGKDEVSAYGIVEIDKSGAITKFLEKPNIGDTSSTLAAVGKYIITPEVFSYLKKSESTVGDGEIRLADAFTKMVQEGKTIYKKTLVGERFDTGNMTGYAQAFIWAALKDEDRGEEIKQWIQNHID